MAKVKATPKTASRFCPPPPQGAHWHVSDITHTCRGFYAGQDAHSPCSSKLHLRRFRSLPSHCFVLEVVRAPLHAEPGAGKTDSIRNIPHALRQQNIGFDITALAVTRRKPPVCQLRAGVVSAQCVYKCRSSSAATPGKRRRLLRPL